MFSSIFTIHFGVQHPYFWWFLTDSTKVSGQIYTHRKHDRWDPPNGRDCKGIPSISGKSRLVKYYNLARWYSSHFITIFHHHHLGPNMFGSHFFHSHLTARPSKIQEDPSHFRRLKKSPFWMDQSPTCFLQKKNLGKKNYLAILLVTFLGSLSH